MLASSPARSTEPLKSERKQISHALTLSAPRCKSSVLAPQLDKNQLQNKRNISLYQTIHFSYRGWTTENSQTGGRGMKRIKKGQGREQTKQICSCLQKGTALFPNGITGPSETHRVNPHQSCTLIHSTIHSCSCLDNTLKPGERTNLSTALHWADESAL